MKIVQIINSLFIAGAEKLVVDLSKKIVQKGHEVDLLLLRSSNSALEQEMLRNKKIKVYILSENKNIYSPSHIIAIRKHLKKYNYDIIHAHLFPAFYWTAIAASKINRRLMIHTEHNSTNRRMSNLFYGWFDKFIYPKYDYHVAISNSVHKSLKNHLSIANSKLINIHNGIDLEAIAKAKRYDKRVFNLGPQHKVLLQVSSFRPQKNQSTLIRALSLLDSDIHLLLVGNGELRMKCVNLTKKLNLDKRVHFLGIRDDVPKLLKTADIIILSTNYEGLSLASIEGMASGRPFVGSNVPGLSEVVDGAGILFRNNDANSLAKAIKKLFSNKKHYKKTIENCLKRSKNFNIDTMTEKYLELYESKSKTK